MRTKFLFSTLAMAAAFSACTQDEIAVNNENIGSFSEVVGAKQVATGFVVTPTEKTASRVGLVDGQYVWTNGDKVAIAWAVKNGASVAFSQEGVQIDELNENVFANHMLVHNGTSFESRSNVFEGWHFAYSPFQYLGKPQILAVNVNPELTLTDLNLDQYNNAPQFSNAIFVTDSEEDVDFETGKVKKSFPLQWVTNTIKPNLVPSEEFRNGKVLKTLKITDITLSVGEGNNIFTNSFTVNPAGLQEVDLDESNKDIAIIDESYFGAAKAFKPVAYQSSTTVNINNDNYKLGAEKSIVRMFLAPTQNASAVTKEDLSFKVTVDAGYFLINGNTEDETNSEAFETILAMLKGTYSLTTAGGNVTFDLTKTGQPTKNITFNLLPEDFHTDYMISNYDQWTKCVGLANELGEDNETPVFTLTDKAEITFDAEHPMIVPDREFKVAAETTAKIIVDGEMAWPTNIWEGRLGNDNMELVVNEEAVLLVNSVIRVKTLTNNGTIKAESGAILGKGLTNEGEVVVAVGAKTTSPATKPGKISYRVPENYDLAAIQQVINEAHVNNLVIGQNVTLECAAPLNLEGINLEINGGSIESEGYAVTANNVTINGGDVCGVNIAGNLTVTEAATAAVCDLYVDGNVVNNGKLTLTDVVVNKTLTNEGEVEINADICTTIGNIVNNATLKANTDVYVETIVLGNSANTTIATGKTIWYSVNEPKFEQNGTTSGKIEYYAVATKFMDDLAAAEEGAVVVMMDNQTLNDLSKIKSGVTIKGAKKDYKLTISETSKLEIAGNVTFENLTIVAETIDETLGNCADMLLFTGNATFKNVEFQTVVAVAGNTTFEACTFNADPSESYGMWIADYGKTVNVINCAFEGTRGIHILNAFDGYFGLTKEESAPTLNISGTEFNIDYKTAVMAGTASTINWGEGNIYSHVDSKAPVYVRSELWAGNPNYKGVIVNGCELWYEF